MKFLALAALLLVGSLGASARTAPDLTWIDVATEVQPIDAEKWKRPEFCG